MVCSFCNACFDDFFSLKMVLGGFICKVCKLCLIFDRFYIILGGTVSVYIDPRMTGEEEGLPTERTASSGTKRTSEAKPVKEDPEPPRISKSPVVGRHGLETLAEDEEEEEDEDGEDKQKEQKEAAPTMKKSQKKLTMLDRSKFGKYIVSYGMS